MILCDNQNIITDLHLVNQLLKRSDYLPEGVYKSQINFSSKLNFFYSLCELFFYRVPVVYLCSLPFHNQSGILVLHWKSILNSKLLICLCECRDSNPPDLIGSLPIWCLASRSPDLCEWKKTAMFIPYYV